MRGVAVGRGILAFYAEMPNPPSAAWGRMAWWQLHTEPLHTHPHCQSSWCPPEIRVLLFPYCTQKQGSERVSDLAEVTQLGDV